MSGQIFISYRREETWWLAGSLRDRLCREFNPDQIFMDIDAIALGEDFVEAIETTVAKCDVLVAVIGNNWLTTKDEHGNRRLDNPEDFVRKEIGTALKRKIRVIPVLVEGASMPRSTDLPDDLKSLVRRHALQVGATQFDDDCRRLVAAVERALHPSAEQRKREQRKREEQERLEAERRAREMSGQIFISYRREDTEGYTGRLYDRLHEQFPQNKIFMDLDSIEPGVDSVKAIEESVSSCDVLVAVIGKRWLTASEGRRPRLDYPQDYVCLEIGTALKRGIRVIPVLVEGALMPQSGQLPEDLKPLARRNALNVSHDRFRADADRLVGAVGWVLKEAPAEQRKREEQERLEVERPARDQVFISYSHEDTKWREELEKHLKPYVRAPVYCVLSQLPSRCP
jgi:TIR domain